MRPNVRPDTYADEGLGGSAEPVAPPNELQLRAALVRVLRDIIPFLEEWKTHDQARESRQWIALWESMQAARMVLTGDDSIGLMRGDVWALESRTNSGFAAPVARAPQGDPPEPHPDVAKLRTVWDRVRALPADERFAAEGKLISQLFMALDEVRVPAPQGDAPPPEPWTCPACGATVTDLYESVRAAQAEWPSAFGAWRRGEPLNYATDFIKRLGCHVETLLHVAQVHARMRGGASSSGSAPPSDEQEQPQ